LRGMTRAVFAPATMLSSTDTSVTFSLPNAVHREKCEQHRAALEVAIGAVTGAALTVQLVVEGETVGAGVPGGSSESSSARPSDDSRAGGLVDVPIRSLEGDEIHAGRESDAVDAIDDEDVDLDDLVDAPPESVKSPIDRLADAFPGSELIDERT
jgi:DNA polymerase III subunit gamma/tau